jgi:GT2 family glycosyltransferase
MTSPSLPRPLLDCDVVVVNYNAGELLAACVGSALGAGAHRVIVVDNASADDSIARIEARFAGDERLRVIRNARNSGFASACNIGIDATEAGTIFFLNPDSTVTAASLARMMQVLYSEPKTGMVGGFLSNPDGSEQPGGRREMPTPGKAFARAFGLSALARVAPSIFGDFRLHQAPLPTAPTPVEAMSGACMLVKRAALDDVGPWDADYFLHCEDLDWCMRFTLKGWQMIFVPDAPVVHEWGACSRSRPVFVEWHKHRGMLRFYRKFYRKQYSGLLWALVVAGVWLRFGMLAVYYTARKYI